jgi:hypothetical protein
MPPNDEHPLPPAHARRSRDDELLADLTAPPPLEEARESYLFWRRRLAQLPRYKRAERSEAEQMAARWKQRLAAAERERYGPGLLEQVFDALSIRWRPNPRRLIAGLGALAALGLLILIALIAALIVFWPEIEPIVRTLVGGGGSD